MVVPPSSTLSHPIFAANLLNALTQPAVVRNYYVRLLDVFIGARVSVAVIVFVWDWFLGFHSNPVQRPQVGYLHLVIALLRWFSSFCSSSGLEQMICALWCRVPITLYFNAKV